jgi:hypothetical protein
MASSSGSSLARVFMGSSAVSYAATRLGMGRVCWLQTQWHATLTVKLREEQDPGCQQLRPVGAVGALQPTLRINQSINQSMLYL